MVGRGVGERRGERGKRERRREKVEGGRESKKRTHGQG